MRGRIISSSEVDFVGSFNVSVCTNWLRGDNSFKFYWLSEALSAICIRGELIFL